MIRQKYLILFTIPLILLLSFLREPLFFTQPRIWAEEGAIHIQFVLNHGLLESLAQPHIGYYSLFNNYIAGFGLSLVGINSIAYVTTISSYLVILLTVITPLLLISQFWDTPWKKVSIIFFSLFIGTSEIWVNTINSQFYFGLFSCLLLLSDISKIKGWKTYYVIVMLVNASLTGITTVILWPLYILKFFRSQQKNNLEIIILLILTIGLAVQFGSLLYLSQHHSIGRFNLGNLPNFPNGVYQNLTSFVPIGGNWIKFLFLLCSVTIAATQKNLLEIIFPALMAIYISLIFAFLALSMSGGGRYGYISSALYFIFLINLSPSRHNKLRWIIYMLIIAALLSGSFLKFFRTQDVYNRNWVPYSINNGQINQQGELEVKIFPQWAGTNWAIKIPAPNSISRK